MSYPGSHGSTRYATNGVDGVLHQIDRFLPRRELYLALCGASVPAPTANVFRANEPPGMLCRRCAAAAAAASEDHS